MKYIYIYLLFLYLYYINTLNIKKFKNITLLSKINKYIYIYYYLINNHNNNNLPIIKNVYTIYIIQLLFYFYN